MTSQKWGITQKEFEAVVLQCQSTRELVMLARKESLLRTIDTTLKSLALKAAVLLLVESEEVPVNLHLLGDDLKTEMMREILNLCVPDYGDEFSRCPTVMPPCVTSRDELQIQDIKVLEAPPVATLRQLVNKELKEFDYKLLKPYSDRAKERFWKHLALAAPDLLTIKHTGVVEHGTPLNSHKIVKYTSQLSELVHLDCTMCTLSDKEIRSIVKNCPKLRTLRMQISPDFTETGLRSLAHLGYLEELYIGNDFHQEIPLGPHIQKAFVKLPWLKMVWDLSISDYPVKRKSSQSEAIERPLLRLTNVRNVRGLVTACSIGGSAHSLERMPRLLPNLKSVHVNYNLKLEARLSGDLLKQMPHLTALHVFGYDEDDLTLPVLEKVGPQLEVLTLRGLSRYLDVYTVLSECPNLIELIAVMGRLPPPEPHKLVQPLRLEKFCIECGYTKMVYWDILCTPSLKVVCLDGLVFSPPGPLESHLALENLTAFGSQFILQSPSDVKTHNAFMANLLKRSEKITKFVSIIHCKKLIGLVLASFFGDRKLHRNAIAQDVLF